MIEQPNKEEILYIIKEIEADSAATQRDISDKLGISLGKTNYLLKALANKGFIKAKNFSNNAGKLHKINYILTKKGLEEKLCLTQHFLERKELEYYALKAEWEKLALNKKRA